MIPRDIAPEMKILKRAFDSGRSLSIKDAAELLGIDIRNARQYIKLLYTEGEVYVEHWKQSIKGPFWGVYAKKDSEDKDAPYPGPTSKTEIARRRRALARSLQSNLIVPKELST